MRQVKRVDDKHKGFDDRRFAMRFAIVGAALLGVVMGFIALANIVQTRTQPSDEEHGREKIAERLEPVADVLTSEEALHAAMEAAAPPQPSAAQAQPQTGEQVVQRVCATCHAQGVLGAPKMHDRQAWAQRLAAADGVDALVQSAMRGKNQMPPRGGDSSLTEQQIREAVEFMRQ